MRVFLYLAVGGVAGTFARYLLGSLLQPQGSSFPWGTLTINIVGSFVLGLLVRYFLGAGGANPELRTGLTVGFCGAFTTMSTFSMETVTLMSAGSYGRAVVYVVTSVGGSIAAAFAGMAIGRSA